MHEYVKRYRNSCSPFSPRIGGLIELLMNDETSLREACLVVWHSPVIWHHHPVYHYYHYDHQHHAQVMSYMISLPPHICNIVHDKNIHVYAAVNVSLCEKKHQLNINKSGARRVVFINIVCMLDVKINKKSGSMPPNL